MCATAALGNGATLELGDAVLVKEVFHAATGKMKTGTVSHAEMLKGWFVMVKDSKGRYAGNKLWGDGWGWSWFDAANRSKTTSTDYKRIANRATFRRELLIGFMSADTRR